MIRTLSITVSLVVSVIALTVAFAQRRELISLKSEASKQQQEAAEATELVVQPVASDAKTPPSQHTPSTELLRLRGEVGQLERRKHELGGVQTENKTLHAQLATKVTNAPGGIALPAGYLRKADAKLAGFNAPEDTIQSMLWAIQNRDTATFVQAFSPEMAKQMEQGIKQLGSAEEFFKEANAMPGLRIVGKETDADNTVVLTIEMIPGDESQLQKVHFKQFDGQWKLLSGF